MSELISGKEARLAWASGEDIQYKPLDEWKGLGGATPISIFSRYDIAFRIKPQTITINGIEVPKPFKPKDVEVYYHLWSAYDSGYSSNTFESEAIDSSWVQFGAWRTEDEIKQIVEALRSVFNVK